MRPGQKGDKLAFYHIGVVALRGRDVASVGNRRKVLQVGENFLPPRPLFPKKNLFVVKTFFAFDVSATAEDLLWALKERWRRGGLKYSEKIGIKKKRNNAYHAGSQP